MIFTSCGRQLGENAGCRVGEIASFEWDWIKAKRVHLPDPKSGPRTVWLSSAARVVIDAIPHYDDNCSLGEN